MKHLLESDNNYTTHLSEQYTRMNENHFRLMISGVKDYAICMLDASGIILTWNEGAKCLKGYDENEIIGKHFSIFYSPEDNTILKPQIVLGIAVKEGRVEDEGWRLKKNGEKFWARVTTTRINDEFGNLIGFSKITRDMSERKKAEETLKKLHNELEKNVEAKNADLAAALVARDEFLMIASHELKTPLTSLKLRLQIGKRNLRPEINKIPTKEELDKIYTQALDQVDSLVTLVEDFLDVSRIQSEKFNLNMQRVDFTQLVLNVVDRFRSQNSKSNIQLNISPDIFTVADAYRMEQVVSNLIMNALKYAPGAPIELGLNLSPDKKNLYLIVKDEGPGIEKSKQEQIFHRFERLTSYQHSGGLGLGLFIVKKIVQGHNGEITLLSEPGEGSSFIIRLPVK